MDRSKKCVMGCPRNEKYSVHRFPSNPKRRAEWCRILGINPKQQRVTICSAHFNDIYIFGARLSKFSVPNPPISKKSNSQLLKSYSSEEEYTSDISNSEDSSTNASRVLKENNVNIESDFLSEAPIDSSPMDNNVVVTDSITKSNTGDFEIRQRDTNELILQFRCIETSNSVMLSFITPQKYALQQQIKKLDEACSRQLKEIQEITTKNARLHEKLKYYRLAMLQWCHVKPMNRYLNFKLKKFRQRAIRLNRRLEIIEKNKTTWDDFWSGLSL